MEKMARGSAIALALAAACVALPASAQVYNNSASTTFNVTLVIVADCTIVANPLDFGSSGVIDTNIDAQTTLEVTCTGTTPYNVGLDAGNVPGSTIPNRLMGGVTAANGATVAYQLYQDPARTILWGNTQAADTLSGVGTGVPQAIPVYGRVPPQETPPPDTYLSTVTATVYF
jgi:spore coat protein U-like protein